MILRRLLFVSLILLSISNLYAQIPRTLSYQAVLTDNVGVPKPDGAYTVTFRLYSAVSGGVALWTESQSVQVKRGLFSAVLGTVTPLGANLTFAQPYWLSLQVAPDAEMTPRLPLTSVGYSFNSLIADGQVVRGINNLRDAVTLQAAGGATITSNGNTLTINAGSGGGGVGIQGIQNTDNTLTILNPNGPTATVNIKDPLVLNGKVGIGTINPISKLHVVSGASDPAPRLESSSTTSFGAGWDFYHGEIGKGYVGVPGLGASVGPGEMLLFGGASTKVSLWSAGARRLTIETNGNVGIGTGTATPVGKLEVVAQDALRLIGYQPFLTLLDANAGYARGRIQSVSGDMNMFTESYMSGANPFAFLKLANNGNVGLGSATPVGKLEVVAQDALRLIGYQPFLTLLDANAGYARGRIQSVDGAIFLATESYLNGSNLNAYVRISRAGDVSVKNLTLRGGADLAEPFDTESDDAVEPGSLMVIDAAHPGKLKLSDMPYDAKVAGIVSGAGNIKPGITLQQDGVTQGHTIVAIAGRVYCKADARVSPIEAGDLLTTSDIPGHAMKATERDRSHGAIIGKAMSSLKTGTGLVLVLVNLQ